MRRNGVKVVASVEIDKNCQKVLANTFHDTKLFDDVTTVKGSDLIDAGFDSKRTELLQEDFLPRPLSRWQTRWSCWRKKRVILGDCKTCGRNAKRVCPSSRTSCICFPVTDGNDFGIVIGTMADLGYSVDWRCA
jgi:site-specific DNA-cytosine methylase